MPIRRQIAPGLMSDAQENLKKVILQKQLTSHCLVIANIKRLEKPISKWGREMPLRWDLNMPLNQAQIF